MATIQTNILLYAAVEQTLRRAMAENKPLTLRQIHQTPDIAKHSSGLQQVRDVMTSLKDRSCLVILPVNPKENKGYRTAYMWAEGATFALRATKPHTKPGKVEKTVFAQPNAKEIELVFQGIEIVVGTNPETGRVRIMIGG